MTFIAAVLLCLAIKVTLAAEVVCPKSLYCPCGRTGKNVTVCAPDANPDFCSKLSKCKTCENGLNFCTACPEGLEGSFCTEEVGVEKSRRKRQSGRVSYPTRGRRPSVPSGGYVSRRQNSAVPSSSSSFCLSIDSPKLGSVRCVSSNEQQICTGKCLPGYRFDVYETEDEMTLTCRNGVWAPLTAFPACKSGGHCDLIVQASGSFNCTTGMDGTRCDIHCYNRYAGRFFCYPGRSWEPDLPRCVRPKEVIEVRQPCRCQNGESCDSSGICVCAEGWTGASCETVMIPEKATCRDPGFIPNGFRRNMDGNDSSNRQTFEEGQSVVYVCTSHDFVLRGSSLLTCREDGTWSSSLPRCIDTEVRTNEVMCPDPGQVANADRLNSDGSPSVGVQQYRVGQSVVYTCHTGFALQRRSLITCLASGAWSFRTPYCTQVTPPGPAISTTTVRPSDPGLRFCRDPGTIINGNRQPKTPRGRRGFPQGSRLEYSCNSGYELIGERTLFCMTSGQWSASRPNCEEEFQNPGRYCVNPGDMMNGQVQYLPPHDERRPASSSDAGDDEDYLEGSRLKYTCDAGYNLVGPGTILCEVTGSWSALPPACVPGDETHNCDNPGPILNGRVRYFPPGNSRRSSPSTSLDYDLPEIPESSKLEYTCDEGYRLQGSRTRRCQSTGFWSSDPPTCMLECGRSFMYITPKVFRGDPTISGDWPWVVSISVPENNSSRFICGGAVINHHTVVTAAHCLVDSDKFILRFGKHHFEIQEDDTEVLIRRSSQVVVHPDYSRTTLDSDIGLVIFEPRIRYSVRVQPVCLPTRETTFQNIMTGRVGYVSGWGDTHLELPSDELMLAKLPVITNQACLDSYSRQNITPTITSNMFCAGYPDARQTVCDGDSGSPFVFYDSTVERFTLEGLVSFGVRGQCGVAGRYAIFTKVFRFLHWIYSTMQTFNVDS